MTTTTNLDDHPLVRLFGDSSRIRIIATLLEADNSLNPTTIADRAGVHPDTWHNLRDSLLATGLVEQAGTAGNSPLYAMDVGDDRLPALRTLAGDDDVDDGASAT